MPTTPQPFHSRETAVLHADFSEVLTEVRVDNLDFKVTWSPLEMHACILWIRDIARGGPFHALGKFSCFDKRDVLEFITRFSTSEALRIEIERRRFDRRLSTLSPHDIENMGQLDSRHKAQAYRDLFNLDALIQPEELAWKRRLMARRFHPDAGGSDASMVIINEAYEQLLKKSISGR